MSGTIHLLRSTHFHGMDRDNSAFLPIVLLKSDKKNGRITSVIFETFFLILLSSANHDAVCLRIMKFLL
jgi:hypothetical protein